MTPQINSNIGNDVQEYREPNETYRINEKNIDGKINNVKSVEQSVRHILSTERYSNPIYDDNYGVELEQYIGKDFGFIVAGIEVTLNEALTQDDRIKAVKVNDIVKIDSSSCLIKFTVSTIYGEIKEEKNVLF